MAGWVGQLCNNFLRERWGSWEEKETENLMLHTSVYWSNISNHIMMPISLFTLIHFGMTATTKKIFVLWNSRPTSKSTNVFVLFLLVVLQGNLSLGGRILDKKQALFHGAIPGRELPWAGCSSLELFVLSSIVVCRGSTAIFHCQWLVSTFSYGAQWKPLHINHNTIGRVKEIKLALITGSSFDFSGE